MKNAESFAYVGNGLTNIIISSTVLFPEVKKGG